jgi:hypothetical protein
MQRPGALRTESSIRGTNGDHGLGWPLLCALILCLANAFKPAVVDDPASLMFVRSILENPKQPFGPPPDGFHLVYFNWGQDAFTLLFTMVVPYWLALGASLFGQNLVLLKLWLFPFCAIFALALSALVRRFAPGYAKPLLAGTVLSPLFLPSLNVMLDVPALALGLGALALFCKAVDGHRTRWGLVFLAGLTAGLAAQTKYSAATLTAAVCAYSLVQRRFLAGILAAELSVTLFTLWEAYLTQVYGQSHFAYQLDRRGDYGEPQLLLPLFSNLGGLTVGITGFLLIGLRLRRAAFAFAGLQLIGFALMAVIPNSFQLMEANPEKKLEAVRFGGAFCGVSGAIFTLALGGAICVLISSGWNSGRIRPRWDRLIWFLIIWLAIELAAYLVMPPFAAARRVMGIFVVSMLIAGNLLSVTDVSDVKRRAVNVIAALSVGVGILFAATDWIDARAEQQAVNDCVDWIRRQPDGDRRIWFTGHWGFGFYGTQRGLLEVCPWESTLEEGDWLIYPNTNPRPSGQTIVLEPDRIERAIVLEWLDDWPWQTIPEFYLSYQPIAHHEGWRVRVSIYRVKKKFLAEPA